MQYVCDAPGRRAWFRIETEGEAAIEAQEMHHSLDRAFRHAREAAKSTYAPPERLSYIERDIGLAAHLNRAMPLFLTLRESDGTPLASAIVPQDGGQDSVAAQVIGQGDADAFRAHRDEIAELERHFGKTLRRQCYRYGERADDCG